MATEEVIRAYLAGIAAADALVEEQREAEGGEAACALSEIVVLDNARYRIDKHFCAVRDGDEEPRWDAPTERWGATWRNV